MADCIFCRAFLYVLLLVCSAVLLGLTAYHIHFTENLTNGDILFPGVSNFYVPIVVELLVTSCLGIICSVCFLVMMVLPPRKRYVWLIIEIVSLIILWVMWLVGAAIITHRWPSLGWCRFYLICRILDSIIAFSWINWGLAFFLIIARLTDWGDDRDVASPAHGRELSQPSASQPVTTAGPA